MLFLTFQICTLIVLNEAIDCENISEWHWFSIGDVTVCWMEKSTSINTTGTSITRSRIETVEGLSFGGNRNISVLPENVANSFPNLTVYYAGICSITEVSKIHFKDLSKLRYLSLTYNRIKSIATDTFEDLKELEYLWLCKKKLKYNLVRVILTNFFSDENEINFMSVNVFKNLKKLKEVYLRLNHCIDEDFTDSTSIAEIENVVQKTCGAAKA